RPADPVDFPGQKAAGARSRFTSVRIYRGPSRRTRPRYLASGRELSALDAEDECSVSLMAEARQGGAQLPCVSVGVILPFPPAASPGYRRLESSYPAFSRSLLILIQEITVQEF